MHERTARLFESGNGPFGQVITIGKHVFGADEPENAGGKDTGPDPFELLLASLGACTAMTIRLYANRRQIPLEHVEVKLRQLPTTGTGVETRDHFERSIILTGNLSPEQRQKLLDIAEQCPVSKTLRRGSDIVTSIEDAKAIDAK